jgi:ribosome-associated translation inhibitor RaiA
MQIKRSREQIEQYGDLMSSQLYDEASLGYGLFYHQQPLHSEGSRATFIAEEITHINEANYLNSTNQFDTAVNEANEHVPVFYLRVDTNNQTSITLQFKNGVIDIDGATEEYFDALTKLAQNLNAQLQDNFGQPIKIKTKSFWSFFKF